MLLYQFNICNAPYPFNKQYKIIIMHFCSTLYFNPKIGFRNIPFQSGTHSYNIRLYQKKLKKKSLHNIHHISSPAKRNRIVEHKK